LVVLKDVEFGDPLAVGFAHEPLFPCVDPMLNAQITVVVAELNLSHKHPSLKAKRSLRNGVCYGRSYEALYCL
jgi:hypothetical protein